MSSARIHFSANRFRTRIYWFNNGFHECATIALDVTDECRAVARKVNCYKRNAPRLGMGSDTVGTVWRASQGRLSV